MAEKVKEGDFILLDYAGRVRGGALFDTTLKSVAEAENVFSKEASYKPLFFVAGKGQLITGLDKAVVGSEVGVEKKVAVGVADAYGERNPALAKLISLNEFKKRDVSPHPGMVLELDEGVRATVQSVSGGRVRVDLNNPLAGKDLEYSFTVVRAFSSAKEKVEAAVKEFLNLELVCSLQEGVARVVVAPGVSKERDYLVGKARVIQTVLLYESSVKKLVFEEEFEAPKKE